MANLGLDGLLAALREAGLRVGVGEVERIRRVFELLPDFSGKGTRQRLKSLLRAVVVKGVEDRAAFERVCDAWLEQAISLNPETIERDRLLTPALGSRRWRWVGRSTVTALVAIVAILSGSHSIRQDLTPPDLTPSDLTPPGDPVMDPSPRFGGEVETRDMSAPTPADVDMPWFDNPTPVWAGWPVLGLGALALMSVAGLWKSLRQYRWLRQTVEEIRLEGPPRVFLDAPAELPRLLDTRQRENLVWSIGRYATEELTRRLDLRQTVRDTARAAGLPQLRFEQARYHREVWLWIDEGVEDSTLRRLAGDIATTLAAHGLPVERATFRGIPERLVTAEGHIFAPREVDERRGEALVAVLTDGRALLRQCASDRQRVRIEALLRQLSRWPRLTFVDFSAGGSPGLSRLLERHELDRVAPEGLATFLATEALPLAESSPPLAKEAPVLAAACALAPAAVDERTAFELGRRLGLSLSPWALRALRAEAGISPGRLRWPTAARVRYVNWLCSVERGTDGEAAAEGVVDRALDFWEEEYEEALNTLEAGTLAYHHLAMERWLVGLWRFPNKAAGRLYELFQGALGEKVRHHLALLTPGDYRSVHRIRLPWSWRDLSATARVMLREMGLGGNMPVEDLCRPGRLWLGIGLSMGLAVGALVVAAFKPFPECQPVTHTDPRTGMEFVRICKGTFMMGSPGTEEGHWDDEGPVHQVTLSEFWIGKYEVTRSQYDHFQTMGPDQPWNQAIVTKLVKPMVGVSWHEARAFCEDLGYQLPTEAQWEYAARAGTTTRWSFGDDVNELGDHAWFSENSDSQEHVVGQKEPNLWGLHDMHGNVWEWCWDRWGSYTAEPKENPLGPKSGEGSVLRGGSFAYSPRFLRSAVRDWNLPVYRSGNFGFRCVRVPRRQP